MKAIPSIANVILVILGFLIAITSLMAGGLLSRVGRKILLQSGSVISSVSTLFVAIGFLVLA